MWGSKDRMWLEFNLRLRLLKVKVTFMFLWGVAKTLFLYIFGCEESEFWVIFLIGAIYTFYLHIIHFRHFKMAKIVQKRPKSSENEKSLNCSKMG